MNYSVLANYSGEFPYNRTGIFEHNASFATSEPPMPSTCGWPVIPALQGSAEISYLRFLDLCSYPILLLLSTVGNAMNLAILCREKSSGSRNNCLIAIALVDLLYMWCVIFAYTENYDAELYGFPRPAIHAAYTQVAGVVIFLQEACVFASAWLIVAFSVERFLVIKHPLKYISASHGKRSLMTVVAIIILALATAFIRLIDYYWVYDNYLRLDPKPKPKPQRPAGLMMWFKIYLWAELIIPVGTFLVILTLNILLLCTIGRQHRLRRSTLQASQSREPVSKSDWCALPMLGSCVILYLVTQIPGLVGNIQDLLDKSCLVQRDKNTTVLLMPLQNFLTNVNFSVNFLLYCGVNAKFREKVHAFLCIGRQWPVAGRKKSYDSNKSLETIVRHHTSSNTKGSF